MTARLVSKTLLPDIAPQSHFFLMLLLTPRDDLVDNSEINGSVSGQECVAFERVFDLLDVAAGVLGIDGV